MNKGSDNNMNRALDMGGYEINNSGNPDKPQSAVPRRFLYRKIQSLVDDFKLAEIKDIKYMLETEKKSYRRIIYRAKGK